MPTQPENPTAALTLDLTPKQEQEYFLATGMRRRSIRLDRKALLALQLLARRQGVGASPRRQGSTTLLLNDEQRRRVFEETGLEVALLPLPHPSTDGFATQEDWSGGRRSILVGERLQILHSRTALEAPGRMAIRLDPAALPDQSVFGTGNHPTTQGMLALLEGWVELGDRVLDFGTGSGVLAIGAARLGASRVVALDRDSASARVAAHNAALNGLSQQIQVVYPSLPREDADAFDLVMANLPSALLVPLFPEIAAWVRPGGRLIAGGFRSSRRPAVCDAATRAHLILQGDHDHEGWIGLVFDKPEGAA